MHLGVCLFQQRKPCLVLIGTRREENSIRPSLIVLLEILLFDSRWIIIVPKSVEIAVSEVKIVVDHGPDPLAISVKHEPVNSAFFVSLHAYSVHETGVAADGGECCDEPTVSVGPLLYIGARKAVYGE